MTRGLPDFDPEDLIWTGNDGSVDPTTVVVEEGYTQSGALEIILLSIIEGHPVGQRSNKDRLAVALEALVGTPRSKRGNKAKDDDDLLLEIAWRFFCAHVAALKASQDNGSEAQLPDVAPIVEDVVATLDSGDPRQVAVPDSVVRRLRRKFNKRRDVLLSRVTLEDDAPRMERLRVIDKVLHDLQAIGIDVNRRVLRPKLLRESSQDRLREHE